jgi:TonB family protein
MYIEPADGNILISQVQPMAQLAMQRRNTTLTIALCASLMVHALVLWVLMWWFVHSTPPPQLAALIPPDDAPIIIKTPPKPPPPPPPAQPKPKLPPPDFSKAHKPPPRDDSGEANGTGTANRSTTGDKPMQAWQGTMEQADLTHSAKPPDDLDKSKLDMPAQAGQQVGDNSPAAPPPSPKFGVAQPTPTPSKPAGSPPLIAMNDPTKPANSPTIGDAPQLTGAAGSPDTKPTPPASPKPTPKEIRGHTAISSDTDSIPFANANSAHFHDGKMEGRKGRKVRTTRIQFDLAAIADFPTLSDPTVVLGVTVDASGNVQDIIVLHSSGSADIDLPCQRAVYNWWFEPGKDKDGHPLPDQWVVTID